MTNQQSDQKQSKNTIEAALEAKQVNEQTVAENSNQVGQAPESNETLLETPELSANTPSKDEDSASATATSNGGQMETPQSPGILSVLQSVIAAMFGIQSDEKRQQDFEQGHPATYIFVGIIIVIIFIFVIIGIVNSALEGSGIPH